MKEQIICSTCGTYYPESEAPETCTICLDERQYVPATGQGWTKPSSLQQTNSIKFTKLQPRLYQLEINPIFAIGQRALLVLSDEGNVLWDCIPLLDEATIEFIRAKGGLKAICFSHPHYYSNMNEWAETFDCPIYIHENDQEHILQTGNRIVLWKGEELELWDEMKIMLIGGHFAGSSILHVPFLSEKGTIICGDTLFLSPNKIHFSIFWSYPNKMPLPRAEMIRLKERFDRIPFDSFYGYQHLQNLNKDVKQIFQQSMERFLA